MALLKPRRSAFSVGEETTWGTLVAPDRFYLLEDGGNDIAIVNAHNAHPSATEGFLPASGVIAQPHHWEAKPPVMCQWDRLGRLMKHIFGRADVVATVDLIGQHTWTPDPTLAAIDGRGLSVEVPVSDTATNVKRVRYSGGKIQEAVFRFEPGENLMLDLDMIGKTIETPLSGTIATTFALSTSPRVACLHAGAGALMTIGGTTVRPRRFQLTIRNGLHISTPNMGDTSIPEPVGARGFTIEWEADAEADDVDFTDEMLFLAPSSTTIIPVVFKLENGVIAGSSPSHRYGIEFTMQRSSIDKGADPNIEELGEPAIWHFSGRALMPDIATDAVPSGSELQLRIWNARTTADD